MTHYGKHDLAVGECECQECTDQYPYRDGCRACGSDYDTSDDGANIHLCADCRSMKEDQSPK